MARTTLTIGTDTSAMAHVLDMIRDLVRKFEAGDEAAGDKLQACDALASAKPTQRLFNMETRERTNGTKIICVHIIPTPELCEVLGLPASEGQTA